MFFVKKQNIDLLRSVRSWGVLGFLLGVAGILSVPQSSYDIMARAQTTTIVLNTGYHNSNQAVIPVPGLDDDWQVIVDPAPSAPATPRPANVVGAYGAQPPSYPIWVQPFPNSHKQASGGECVPAPKGLDHWWPFDETAPTTIAHDIVAGRDGTTQVGALGTTGSPKSVSGKVAQAFEFDGSSAFVSVADSSGTLSYQSPNSFTIDAWIKVDPHDKSGVRPIVDKRLEIGGQVAGYQLFLYNGKLGFQLADGVGNHFCGTPGSSCTNYGSTADVADGKWHFVAAVIDRGTNQIMLYDGPESGTLSLVFTGTARANAANNEPLRIGHNNPTVSFSGQFFKGLIDEVEIFNRALDQSEIQAIFKSGSAGKCKPQPTADLGDAPDSSNHSSKVMDAYPSVPAKFPTVFDPATGLPQGPKHLQPKGLAWLGKDVSFEDEADFLPDADGVTNIDPTTPAGIGTPNRDNFDDSVVPPIAIPLICGQTQFKYTVTSTGAAKLLYVNVWFDFNRDGDWNDPIQKCPLGPAVTGSFTEWAVQNEPISVVAGLNSFITPVFGAANPTKGQDMWMRITLTDQPIAPANGADASGPATGYKYGETEDYLWRLTYTEICGIKWNDLNGDGKQDPNEPGLADWVIEVKDANGNIIGYAVTDANGKYCIVVPSPGTYIVSEQQQQGWTQTAPSAPGTYTVTIPPAQTNLNFGNQEKQGKAEICVFKFEDLDEDGVQDPNEPLIAWTFNVSPGPPTQVTTQAGGGFCFGVPAPSTQTITEVIPPPPPVWTPTTLPSQTVTVQPGQLVNVFFGNKRKEEPKYEICGIKFNDLNGNGKQDSGEPGLPNWTINLVFGTPPNLIDVQAITDASGRYCFKGLAAGIYKISETLQPGWVQTFPPNPGTYTVTLPPSVTNINFGNKKEEEGKCDLAIRKTVDPNPPVMGQPFAFKVEIFNAGNGPCPPTTTVTDNLPIGFPVTLFNPNTAGGWVCSGPPNIVCNNPTLTLKPGQSSTVFAVVGTFTLGAGIENCAELRNQKDSNSDNNRACVRVQPPGKAEICVFKFEDLNGNGRKDPNEPLLAGWTFNVNPGPPNQVTTGPQGGICFGVTAPGTYMISEVVQSGWTPTTLPSQTVTVQPGQLVNLFFGNRKREEGKCDLAIRKEVKGGKLVSGQQGAYIVTIVNGGNGNCNPVITVQDALGPGLVFVSAGGPPGIVCGGTGQTVTCTSNNPLGPGQSFQIQINVMVRIDPGKEAKNCAAVKNPNDANLSNNEVCITTVVQKQ